MRLSGWAGHRETKWVSVVLWILGTDFQIHMECEDWTYILSLGVEYGLLDSSEIQKGTKIFWALVIIQIWQAFYIYFSF